MKNDGGSIQQIVMNSLIKEYNEHFGPDIFKEKITRGNLIGLFETWGIHIYGTYGGKERRDSKDLNRTIARYDGIILTGNNETILVDTIAHFKSTEDIDCLIKNISIYKKYLSDSSDRNFYGGIAYIEASLSLITQANNQGIFLFQIKEGKDFSSHLSVISNLDDFFPKKLF